MIFLSFLLLVYSFVVIVVVQNYIYRLHAISNESTDEQQCLTLTTTCICIRREKSCWGHRSNISSRWNRSRKVPWCHWPSSDTWSYPRTRFLWCSNSRSPNSCQTNCVAHGHPDVFRWAWKNALLSDPAAAANWAVQKRHPPSLTQESIDMLIHCMNLY